MATVSFRMDDTLKRDMEKVCEDMGMNMTTAFTIFAKKVSRERRIPFEVSGDPFYAKENMAHLERVIGEYEAGNVPLVRKSMEELEGMLGDA